VQADGQWTQQAPATAYGHCCGGGHLQPQCDAVSATTLAP